MLVVVEVLPDVVAEFGGGEAVSLDFEGNDWGPIFVPSDIPAIE